MKGWKAWYADGSVYTSRSTRWTELPKDGILGVVVYHEPPYRTVVTGGDWFYPEDEIITSSPEAEDGWIDPPDISPELLKRGVQVGHREWEDTRREMMEDTRWP